MNLTVPAAIALIACTATPVMAQDLTRYRDYELGSSLAVVVQASGALPSEVSTLHERPARIEQVDRRTGYVSSATAAADPVRDLRFSFVDGRLYQIVVRYERSRMEGLTNKDVIDSLSTTYGAPVPLGDKASRAPLPSELTQDAIVVARWEDADGLVVLSRDIYSSQFQLAVISKALGPQARTAIREATRLDIVEGPQRERDQLKKDAAEAEAAAAKQRATNKAAFKP